MSKKIIVTKKEQIVLERLLNTFIDSDYFSESLPKGIKDEKEANDAMINIVKKLSSSSNNN